MFFGMHVWLFGGWARTLARGHVSQPPPAITEREESAAKPQQICTLHGFRGRVSDKSKASRLRLIENGSLVLQTKTELTCSTGLNMAEHRCFKRSTPVSNNPLTEYFPRTMVHTIY